MELLNRRHIMFAVVGAAGLALAVDKLVLSDGLSSPGNAAAGEVAQGPTTQPGTDAQKLSDVKAKLSPASRLSVYRKASLAGDAGVGNEAPGNAMAYPAWVPSEASPSGVGAVGGNVFVLSGIASNSIRLKREGDPETMQRGHVLKVGEQVAWSQESGVTVRLVSIAHDKKSAVIEVDGERRQLRWSAGEGTESRLSPSSTIHVEKSQDAAGKF